MTRENGFPILRAVKSNTLSILKSDIQLLSAELDYEYLAPEQTHLVRFGLEYTFQQLLALRTGYAFSSIAAVSGLTFGLGFKFKIGQVGVMLDYALKPQFWENSDLQAENMLGLGVKF